MQLFKDFSQFLQQVSSLILLPNRKQLLLKMLSITLILSAFEWVSLSFVVGFVSTLLGSGNPVSLPFGDTLIFDVIGEDDNIIGLAAGLIIIMMIRGIITLWLTYHLVQFCQNIVATVRDELVKSLMSSDYLTIKTQIRAGLQLNLTDLSSRFGGIVANLIKAFSDLLIVIVILLFLSLIDLRLLLSVAAFAFVWVVIFDSLLGPRLKRLGKEMNNANKVLISTSGIAFDGYKEIKLLSVERWFQDKLIETAKSIAKISVRHSVLFQSQTQIIEITSVILLVGFAAVATLYEQDASKIIAIFSVFAVGIMRAKTFIATVSKVISDFRYSSDLMTTLTVALALDDNKPYFSSSIAKPTINENESVSGAFRSLNLNGVTFRYSGADKPLFENVSLKISRGDFAGIFGKSGEGKTTLLDIIAKLIEPDSGTVTINGKTGQQAVSWLRTHLGYIPQGNFLVEGTIAENITLGASGDSLNDQKVKTSLQRAGLKEFTHNMDYNVGEAGKNISGGQQQRLAIARLFFRQSQFIVFDESTNSIDKRTEEEIFEAIKAQGDSITTLVVTHDASSLKYCNKIYVLAENKLAGPFDYTEFQENVSVAKTD